MKRDFDLVRLILLEMEKKDPENPYPGLEIKGYHADVVKYHLRLLIEQKFIFGDAHHNTDGTFICLPYSLTWTGHDFLDAARDTSIWLKAKKTITDKTQTVSFEVLKAVLVQIAKKMIFSNP